MEKCLYHIFSRATRYITISTWFLKYQVSLIFFFNFEISSLRNQKSIWFRNWFLQATQAVKIKFELEKKKSLIRNWFISSLFKLPNWHVKNQVQIDTGIAMANSEIHILEWIMATKLYGSVWGILLFVAAICGFVSSIASYIFITYRQRYEIKWPPGFFSWIKIGWVIPLL